MYYCNRVDSCSLSHSFLSMIFRARRYCHAGFSPLGQTLSFHSKNSLHWCHSSDSIVSTALACGTLELAVHWSLWYIGTCGYIGAVVVFSWVYSMVLCSLSVLCFVIRHWFLCSTSNSRVYRDICKASCSTGPSTLLFQKLSLPMSLRLCTSSMVCLFFLFFSKPLLIS